MSKWLKEGAAISSSSRVVSEAVMELSWGLLLYFARILYFFRNDTFVRDNLQILDGVAMWKCISHVANAWPVFCGSKWFTGDNISLFESRSKYFQIFYNMETQESIALPCPFDTAWNYTHILCQRMLHLAQLVPCQEFATSAEYKNLVLLSIWDNMYRNLWNLNISDIMSHHGYVCHVQSTIQPCMASTKQEYVSSSRLYCNNVFPKISTSHRPALCCSAFPPFLVNFLIFYQLSY